MCLIPESPRPQMPMMPFALELVAADLDLASNLTQKTCGGCHVFGEGDATAKTGPNLYGIVGAKYGSSELFAGYSGALSGDERSWDYDGLNAFLAGPGAWVPGTKMSYSGQADQSKRALYVAYLRSLSGEPMALPSQEEIDALQAEMMLRSLSTRSIWRLGKRASKFRGEKCFMRGVGQGLPLFLCQWCGVPINRPPPIFFAAMLG